MKVKAFRHLLSQMTEDVGARDNSKQNTNDNKRYENIVERCSGYGKIAACEVNLISQWASPPRRDL